MASSSEKGKEIGIVLTALVGASIPVIVRHEVAPASVSLSHLDLIKNGAASVLALQFNRAGNSSVYGDLEVVFTSQGGAEQLIGRAGPRGLACDLPRAPRSGRHVVGRRHARAALSRTRHRARMRS